MKRAVWALALLACACAQVELKPPSTVDFDLAGRIAARYGNEAFTGNIGWRHAGGGDELLISTPLGQGVARACFLARWSRLGGAAVWIMGAVGS